MLTAYMRRKTLTCLEDGCFAGDTPVFTKNGLQRIDEIQAGEYVLAKDVNTGEIGYKQVTQVYIKSTTEFIRINIEGIEIRTTASHLFFTDVGWWKAAENINVSDKIMNSQGEFKAVISKIEERLSQPERIYNLNIEGYHTYFVGNQGLLVHNDCTEAMTAAIKSADSNGIASILKAGYDSHLTDVVDFTQSRAVIGGHDKTNFFNYINSNNIQINVLSETPHPSINGIEEITYQIPAKDSAGNTITDNTGNIVWKNQQFRKTIFDPNIISDTEMIEMGGQAMKEGLDSLRLVPQTNSNTIINGIAPNGLKFTGYWNPTTGLIENYHPVLDW